MTERQLESRESKSDKLMVFQVDAGSYYVQSSQKMVCYLVTIHDDTKTCACADYAMHANDPGFTCKHILAVLNGNGHRYELHEKGKIRLDKRFITNIKGRDFVLYEGLLDGVTRVGLKKSHVTVVQLPSEENHMTATCQAFVETIDGRTFMEVGDASPASCRKDIAPHLIRMAATRSKARAYRDLLNIGITCSVELSEADLYSGDTPSEKEPSNLRKLPKKETRPPEPKKDMVKPPGSLETVKTVLTAASQPKPADAAPSTDTTSKPGISQAQRNAIENLSKRRGISPDEVKALALKQFNTEPDNLTASEASLLIRLLQQAA